MIDFVEVDSERIIADMVSGYEDAWLGQTGERITLSPTDPIYIFLLSQALQYIQALATINLVGNQNLVRHSTGKFLNELGDNRNVFRAMAQPSECDVVFKFSQPLPNNRVIPRGIRVTNGDNVYFATTQNTPVAAGSESITVRVVCQSVGSATNNYAIGELNILVDPLPWVEGVRNVTVPTGGTDTEGDESYRARIRLSPEGFSVGTELGYEYTVREYDPTLWGVQATSPKAGCVDICVLGAGGKIPPQAYLDALLGYLMGARDKRIMTDNLSVSAPKVVDYDIDLTYYLPLDTIDIAQARANILQAIEDFALWQKSRIGRDIDPSQLIKYVKNATRCRVVVNSPDFVQVKNGEIAIARDVSANFGGLEDE